MSAWYDTDQMVKVAKDRDEKYGNGEIDNGYDGDSYRLLYEGKENTNIESHNALDYHADLISMCINIAMSKYAKSPKKLADLGGGADSLQMLLKGERMNWIYILMTCKNMHLCMVRRTFQI